ncbi:MAG TPA: glycosyltransferase family 4 protein [Candidatus Methylomirabilis sp.]|nr:glycosyltransferase family 4 protein [Candidatus Methylomirabilis sp.]
MLATPHRLSGDRQERSRMTRVLHIITRLDVGGSTENTVISATRLSRTEFSSSLISGRTLEPPPGLRETLRAAQVPWFEVPCLVRPISPANDLRALAGIWRLVRKLRPDIVHTHSSKAGFVGRLAARMAGVPRILYTPHGHVFQGYFSPLVTRGIIAMERIAARWTDRIITLTDAEAEQHLALGIGRPERFVTIPSGIDLARLTAAAPRRFPAHGPIVGTVARLAPVKGHRFLLEAMPGILQSCPEARFVFVGEGEARPALEEQARHLGLGERIIFTGFREDAPALLAGMDLFVLPSLNEGMGRVLVMAMALGKPIVATRVGGVPELLGDGEAGILVPPGDSAALAEAVTTLLRDPARAAALAEAGRRRATRYDAETMLSLLAKVYREVMEGARAERLQR